MNRDMWIKLYKKYPINLYSSTFFKFEDYMMCKVSLQYEF